MTPSGRKGTMKHKASAPVGSAPPGADDRIWIVSHSGENHLLVREPIGGIEAWARGVDATVREYRLVRKFEASRTKTVGGAVR